MDKQKPEKSRNPHEGHRDRLRARFAAEGLDHFEPHVILELVLFYAIPRRDTNPVAHELMRHFGDSLSRVFDAPVEELVRVKGMTKNAAVLIKLFPEVCRRYLMDYSENRPVIRTSADAARRLVPLFFGKTNESVVLLCLDSKGKVLFCNEVFEGSVNAAFVSARRIVEVAVRYATTDVILSHNHPSGTAVPSRQDIMATEQVAKALKAVDIRLTDHIVVADNDWVSMAATPTLHDLFAGGGWYSIG